MRLPRVLSIAGSDSCGGAGVQADIKTATALGAYAMTAITAVTAQDTRGVHLVQLIPAALVRAQIKACLKDIGADAIKVGMLGSAEIASAVADSLREYAPTVPVVLDPVLASTSGTRFLDEEGVRILKESLVPIAALVTPNIPEAEFLSGIVCNDADSIVSAGAALIAMGAGAVLIKGGHDTGDTVVDRLMTGTHTIAFEHARIDTIHTHGTGCTYSSAIAVEIAKGRGLRESVKRASAYVLEAIADAPELGQGHGPLNHMHGRLPQND